MLFPFVKWSARFCSPGIRLIFILPDLVISCSHKYLNSTCRVLPKTSSRRYRFGSVGISPNSHLGGHAQVCHHRLHSKSLRCTRDDCVILGFCRAQRTRRLRSGQCFTTVPLIIIIPPLVDFLSGPLAQFESTCTSTFTSNTEIRQEVVNLESSTSCRRSLSSKFFG